MSRPYIWPRPAGLLPLPRTRTKRSEQSLPGHHDISRPAGPAFRTPWATNATVPCRTGSGAAYPTGSGAAYPTGCGVAYPTGSGVAYPTGSGVAHPIAYPTIPAVRKWADVPAEDSSANAVHQRKERMHEPVIHPYQ